MNLGKEYPQYPVAAVGAVVLRAEKDGKWSVLLVRRANPPHKGEWSLPGGSLELGETLEAAISREVYEETGLSVEPLAVVDVFDLITRDAAVDESKVGLVRFHYVLVDFLCCIEDGKSSEPSFAADVTDASWWSLRDIEDGTELHLTSRTLEVIRKAVVLYERGELQPRRMKFEP